MTKPKFDASKPAPNITEDPAAYRKWKADLLASEPEPLKLETAAEDLKRMILDNRRQQ